MNQAFPHDPVMATEVVELFSPVPSGWIVDATLGGGGHAAALLAAHPGIRLLGLDRDPSAVAAAGDSWLTSAIRAMVRRPASTTWPTWSGPWRTNSVCRWATGPERGLFDLGVSSPAARRGRTRGSPIAGTPPLDMRMDPSSGRTAADVVNDYDEDALVELFADNGEGRFARRIARAMIAARPVTTTGQLADVVREAIPAATRRTGGHPARKVFQAIRIAVNEELDQLAPPSTPPSSCSEAGRSVRGHLLSLGRGPDGQDEVHPGGDRRLPLPTRASVRLRGRPAVPPGRPGGPPPDAKRSSRNRRAEAARLRVIEAPARRRDSPRPTAKSPDGAAAATARRACVRAHRARPGPPGRRFGSSSPRRGRTRPAFVRRSAMWVGGALVVGSLLAVVVGDALISAGPGGLSSTQSQLAAAVNPEGPPVMWRGRPRHRWW